MDGCPARGRMLHAAGWQPVAVMSVAVCRRMPKPRFARAAPQPGSQHLASSMCAVVGAGRRGRDNPVHSRHGGALEVEMEPEAGFQRTRPGSPAGIGDSGSSRLQWVAASSKAYSMGPAGCASSSGRLLQASAPPDHGLIAGGQPPDGTNTDFHSVGARALMRELCN